MTTPPNDRASFLDRLRDPKAMGVQQQGNLNVLTPTPVFGSASIQPPYTSSYELRFQFNWQDLVAGFEQPAYTHATGQDDGPINMPWGPEQVTYPRTQVPEQFKDRARVWYAERLVAVAASMVGYYYRHHHRPDWNPQQSWYTEWNEPSNKFSQTIQQEVQAVKQGQAGAEQQLQKTLATWVGKGLDCSNFTRFIFNYALGIQLNSQTDIQANPASTKHPFYTGGQTFKPQVVADANDSYDVLCTKLQPGDLLFIAGNHDEQDIRAALKGGFQNAHTIVNHVIMWLGDIGYSKSNTPLIMDSHGGDLLDDNGKIVPTGIWVRPFHSSETAPTTFTPEGLAGQTWYFDHFAWALRYF